MHLSFKDIKCVQNFLQVIILWLKFAKKLVFNYSSALTLESPLNTQSFHLSSLKDKHNTWNRTTKGWPTKAKYVYLFFIVTILNYINLPFLSILCWENDENFIHSLSTLFPLVFPKSQFLSLLGQRVLWETARFLLELWHVHVCQETRGGTWCGGRATDSYKLRWLLLSYC